MHEGALSKTAINVLRLLTSRPGDRLAIREVAAGVGQGYRIVYDTVQSMAGEGFIRAERRGNVTLCSLDPSADRQVLAYVEHLKARRLLEGSGDVRLVVRDIMGRISSPYYSLVVFGSRARGTARSGSDLDLLFIVPDKRAEAEIASAVAAAELTTPFHVHETTLAAEEFRELVRQEGPNVAKEARSGGVVVHGAEAYYGLVGGA